VCGDFIGRCRPGQTAPDIVTSALESIQAEPAQAIFVGDTVWDVQAADVRAFRPRPY
jgi:phosphoglycolate phosphatase-like HAD superfamily hydrolase